MHLYRSVPTQCFPCLSLGGGVSCDDLELQYGDHCYNVNHQCKFNWQDYMTYGCSGVYTPLVMEDPWENYRFNRKIINIIHYMNICLI